MAASHADQDQWAKDLEADGFEVSGYGMNVYAGEKPTARILFAFPRDMDPLTRDEFAESLAQQIEDSL